MQRLHRVLSVLPLALLALLAPAAQAGGARFVATGTVASGSAPSGPFAGIGAGAPVRLSYEVDLPGSFITASQRSFAIDGPTLTLEMGAASAGLGSGTPTVLMRNADPSVDGILGSTVFLAGGNRVDFSFSSASPNLFTSTDPLQNLGSWSGPFYSAYDFTVYGVGAFFSIDLATFAIELPIPGASFCAGDGSLTDHTTACPCGNTGGAGRGCAHSFDANGAALGALGVVALDNVVLRTEGTPATSFTLFMQHDALDDRVFHDGTLCAGGTLIRLRGRGAVGGQAAFPDSNFANDSMTLSQRGQVTVGSGDVRYYAGWYRNASTTFCPPATANVTNGWRLTW